MNNFILIASIITIITLGLLLLPLLIRRKPISYERQEQNIHFAKERLQELEAQLKNAAISATDYEALKLEIESTLADDINISNSPNIELTVDQQSSGNKVLIFSVCILVPIFAATAYTLLGTPQVFETAAIEKQAPSPQEIEQMLVSIEQRLAANPNDPEGWTVLSRTYLALGRYQDAEQSFLKLIEVSGESANIYAQLADTNALITGGKISADALTYVNKALALDPLQPQALWLAGLHAAENGQTEQARVFWNQLLPLLAQVPQQQQELRAIIDQTFATAQTLDKTPITALPAPAEGSPAPAESSIAPAESSIAPAEGSATINLNIDVNLTISVKLSPELIDKTNPSDTVFVFARGQNGPPAPLAVKRLLVSDLPVEITLGDADAMVPQLKLSLFEDVQVSARIAKSGNPIAQAGDLQSLAIKIKNNETKKLELIISETVNE